MSAEALLDPSFRHAAFVHLLTLLAISLSCMLLSLPKSASTMQFTMIYGNDDCEG